MSFRYSAIFITILTKDFRKNIPVFDFLDERLEQ